MNEIDTTYTFLDKFLLYYETCPKERHIWKAKIAECIRIIRRLQAEQRED